MGRPTWWRAVSPPEPKYTTLFRSLANSGGASVVYSSDLHEISALADRILILRRDGTSDVVAGGLPARAEVHDALPISGQLRRRLRRVQQRPARDQRPGGSDPDPAAGWDVRRGGGRSPG